MLNNYTWRDKAGKETKMIDAPDTQIQQWFTHCEEMLFNNSTWNFGKYVVRENIQNLWDACNTELLLRYLHAEGINSFKTNKDILDYIQLHREKYNINIDSSVSSIFEDLPAIFHSVSLSMLMDGCFDKLAVFNKKMLTDKFILSQGIWLTDSEKQELTEYTEEGKIKNRLEIIKDRLCLPESITLRVSPKGFSYSEFRTIIQLPLTPKISALSSNALKVLRDKVLLLLNNDLSYYIDKWIAIMSQVKEVAKKREIILISKNYDSNRTAKNSNQKMI